MNTLKFQRKNLLATEQHNLESVKIIDDIICGKQLKLYIPCNLVIFVTNACQNKCKWCINKNYKFNDSIDTKSYLLNLEEILANKLDNKKFEITITGGEPTLYPQRLLDIMKLCKKYNYQCRTFSSTGYNIFAYVDNKPICQHMIENGFIHNINISRMMIDQKKSDEIFGYKNLTNSQLEKLALFFKTNNAEMRLSCNIMKNGISNMNSLLNYVDFYSDIGIDSVIFRELVGYNEIKLLDLVRTDKFKFIKQLHGEFYTVDVYEYKDFIVKYYKQIQDISSKATCTSIISLNDGILREYYNGDILYEYR